MMQLIADNKDLSQLVEKITWSGDVKQIARKLVFTVATKDSDKHLPKATITEGSTVTLKADGKLLFGGIIFDAEKTASSNVTTYTAFDLLFYVNNSDISRVFDATPEAITAQVCGDLGIPFGTAAPTGIKVYVPCLGKKAYEAIMMAYTAASRQNGKKYLPVMRGVNSLCVIEKGAYCGVILDGGYNLTDASYKTSLQQVVNKVIITDKSGGTINTLKDDKSPLPGIVQRVYKQEDGKDAATEAKALLHGMDESASVTAISDIRAVTGVSIAIREPITGLYGRFYIDADTHTFAGTKSEMQLTLAFSNMMDEKEIQKETENGGEQNG